MFVNEPRRALQLAAGVGCACGSSVTRTVPAWGLSGVAGSGWRCRRRADRRDRIGRRPLAADPTQPAKNFGLALSASTRARGNKLPRVPVRPDPP
jgi:hypothetical protein